MSILVARRISLATGAVLWSILVIACAGGGGGGKPAATEKEQEQPAAKPIPRPVEPTHSEQETGEKWAAYVAHARAVRKAQLDSQLAAAEARVEAAKKPYVDAYQNFKPGAPALKAKLDEETRARDRIKVTLAGVDEWEPEPPPDHVEGASVLARSRTVHVRGYYRKDGTYVPPYNRSPRSR